MKIVTKLTVIPVATLALLGFSSLSASARIVCNEDGDCWHVHEDYAYPPAAGVIIHPDNWRWKEGERHAWRLGLRPLGNSLGVGPSPAGSRSELV